MEFKIHELNGFKSLSITISAMNEYTNKIEKNTFYFKPSDASFTFSSGECWFPADQLLRMQGRLFFRFIEPAFTEFLPVKD